MPSYAIFLLIGELILLIAFPAGIRTVGRDLIVLLRHLEGIESDLTDIKRRLPKRESDFGGI